MSLPFVNVKRIVIAHLKPILAPVVPRSKLPATLDASSLPVVQVFRSPGSENQHTAFTRIDLHVFAATEDAVWSLSEKALNGMTQLSGRVIEGHRFDVVRVIQDPSDLPWSSTVERTVSVYEIPVRPAMMKSNGPAVAGQS